MIPVIVGKNQIFYIGSRRFVEGDIIPSALSSGIEIIRNDKIESEPEPEIEQEEPKKTYRPRTKKDLFSNGDQE
jgi:hypothetical protein